MQFDGFSFFVSLLHKYKLLLLCIHLQFCLCVHSRPDMTSAVDCALKDNYLSIYGMLQKRIVSFANFDDWDVQINTSFTLLSGIVYCEN